MLTEGTGHLLILFWEVMNQKNLFVCLYAHVYAGKTKKSNICLRLNYSVSPVSLIIVNCVLYTSVYTYVYVCIIHILNGLVCEAQYI